MAGVLAQQEAGKSPWGPTNGTPVYVDGQLAGWRAPDQVPTAQAAPSAGGGLPASLQSLARATGATSNTQSSLDAERLRQAGVADARENREDEQAFQLQMAGLKGGTAAASGGGGASDPLMLERQAAQDKAYQDQLDRQFKTESSAKDREYQTQATAQQQAYDTQKTAAANAAAQAAQERMYGYIKPYLDQTSSGAPVVAGDDTSARAAQDAAFARAKDRTANIARSSLMALRQAGVERGINVAGGANPSLTATEGRLMGQASAPLSDLVRQQAIDETTRAQSVADRNYQGAIQQAGQRASLAPSLLSLLRTSGAVY